MTTQETCPYCGAEVCAEKVGDLIRFDCIAVGCGLVQCLKKQIEQRAAEIERLRQVVLDEREACAQLCERHVCASECSDYGLGSNCEAVIADEIRARGEVK